MRGIFFFTIVLFTYSCAQNKKDCSKVMCTTLFASVNCTLTDSLNPSLSGITTQTVLVATGAVLHEQSGPGAFPDSSFVVVDDASLQTLTFNATQKVILHVRKNGTLLKSVEFTIVTDCCHVSKTLGPDKVSLN